MSAKGRRSRRSRLLLGIAGLATRRSRLVIGIWIFIVGMLAFVGRNLEHELGIHPLYIDGTASKRAHEIALHEFGSDYALVVMLRGPHAQVESQGRRLAAGLEAMPRTLVVTPWAGGGTIDGLSPSPDVAALIVRVEASEAKGVASVLPPVRRAVDARIEGPVRASVAGFPVVVDSLSSASDSATKLGELIAIPVLLIVLLLVFRSVIAAVAPIVIGGAVVMATRGLLSILHGFIQLDVFAIGVVGMMGLALGVDYSLLVISRFREERRKSGGEPGEVARVTVLATARSVVPAGGGLIFAMLVAAMILPGSIARSVSIAVILATMLSMVSAICVVPALLTILGDNLDRWALPMRQSGSIAPLRWSRHVANRPGAVIAIVLVLVLLSGWAFTLNSGAASIAFLPPGDAGRQQQEEVEGTLGPGWTAPMEVIVDGRGQPVTSSQRLRALARFQHHVERDPGVQTMAGFSPIARGAEQVAGIEGELAEQERGLDHLATGIGKAHRGASLTTAGLSKAAAGSGELEAGLGAAHGGAGVLAGALQKVGQGSEQLSAGLGRVGKGSGKVAQGTSKASDGAGRLADALGKAGEQAGELSNSAHLIENAMHAGDDRLGELHAPLQGTEARLAAAWQALQRMSSGRSDPEYAAALAAVEEASRQLTGKDIGSGEPSNPPYEGVGAGVERAEGQFGVGLYLASRLDKNGQEASKGIEKLADASSKLDRGLQRLSRGSRQVSRGAHALDRGGAQLPPALQRLGDGAQRLTGGLSLLETGSGQLTDGLGQGARKSRLLGNGLGKIESALEGQGGESGLARLRDRSPGVFHSAYFILAGLDGSKPRQRSQLGSLINLDRGGMDARMLIVPRDAPTSDAAGQTKDRLEDDAADLARKTGTEVVVGGVAPAEIDVNDTVREQSPLMRLALSLVTLLVLIPVMRSLTIPLLAALINLITISASFGILALLFNGSLFGGPGYIDAAVIPATMMVMFGLAIDYEVFVFARIREEYVRTGSTKAAVAGGLDRTAHVVTGAAVIMICVFLAFSVSELVTIRNFGVAQSIAVGIDAFIVRLMVVPAMMVWLDKWSWWMPGWLGRRWPSARPGADSDFLGVTSAKRGCSGPDRSR
jgi:RND superfamily putative drug exporter